MDLSLSDFIQESIGDIPDNALIFISDDTIKLSPDKRILFIPNEIRLYIKDEVYYIDNVGIPIRKLENDMELKETISNLAVHKKDFDYINLNDISKSMSWWIVNNAEELKFPQKVEFYFLGTDMIPRKATFIRDGKMKWILTKYGKSNI